MTSPRSIPEGYYPMRVVTRLTGLSADTIRAWERRYGAVFPERTGGNARRYSAEQVRRLVLLREATSRGHSISEVAQLSGDELLRLAYSETGGLQQRPTHQQVIDEYLAAVRKFEAQAAQSILTRTMSMMLPEDAVFRMVIPLLHQVGKGWCEGSLSIAHEHLVSSQLRGLLGTMLRHAAPRMGFGRIVIATPPKHDHEFGSLIGAFIASTRGLEPIYLGTNMPFAELERVMAVSRAEILLLSIVREVSESEEAAHLEQGVRNLSEAYEVWLGLPEHHSLASKAGPVRQFHRFEDFDTALVHRTL